MERIGAAIIGCGGIANIHAKTYSNIPLTELVAVADVIEERAKHFVQRFQAKKSY